MKKTMAALVAGIILTAVPVAAEPIKISGDTTVKYQRDTTSGENSTSGAVYGLKLMGEIELGEEWSFFTRLGVQHVTNSSFADFNLAPEAYGDNPKTVVSLDQFGFSYKSDYLVYKFGRQDATVGITALLYSRPDSNIGKKTFLDGLTMAGTIGASDISVLAAKEDNISAEEENKVYAIRTGYSPTEKVAFGLTLGRYQSDESTNHWAFDGKYNFGKNSLTAEYTKSSSKKNNTAYVLVWSHDTDDRISASITAFRVEEHGSMGQQSDFDADNHGFHYNVNYKFNDDHVLNMVYKNQKTISGGKKNSLFEVALNNTF